MPDSDLKSHGVKLSKSSPVMIKIENVHLAGVQDGFVSPNISSPSSKIMFLVQFKLYHRNFGLWSIVLDTIITDGRHVWGCKNCRIYRWYDKPLPRKPIRLAIGECLRQLRSGIT